MFNSVVLLPPPGSASATALAGSRLANVIFRSSGAGGSSLSSQGSPGMLRGLVDALQPLLSYLAVLVRSMGPSPLELQLVSRLVVAASVGMFIGTERRTSHRPAGVRTMSLVALGACTFTLVSQFGFVGKADQARVAASVASGVGFIGAGVITTSGKEASIRDSLNIRGRGGSRFPTDTTSTYNDVDGEVRGLTTASAIWITAGLGMACGAGLFFVATLGAVLTVGILKISEVITTLRNKWIRLRKIVRPKLAQRIAEEEEARVKAEKGSGEASGLVEKDHKEDNEETEEDKELREKEMREKREKEEKEEKEKEKNLEMEREKERQMQAEAEKTKIVAAGATGAEQGGKADDDPEDYEGEQEEDWFDEDDDFEDLYKRPSEDVDVDDDPFYGRLWSAEVPKVRRLATADNGGAAGPPPISGPARRRFLSRSRVLASRKSRGKRLLRYGTPVASSPSASPDTPVLRQQKPDEQPQGQGQAHAQEAKPTAPASVIPTTVGGGKVAVDSALANPVKTVGDFMSEKQVELKQQQTPQQEHEQQEQQQPPPPPPKKQRKPKKVTKQQTSSVAKAYVPDNDDEYDATPEPATGALLEKPTKSRGRSQSGGGDDGDGAKPKDRNVQEATPPPKTTVKNSSGVPAAAAVKASNATPGGRAEGKPKADEMPSSRGEPAELGEVVEGAAAARMEATAEARARLADSWGGARGLDGSSDASV
eukprot:g6422.t1